MMVYSVRGLERSELADLMTAQGAFGTDFYDWSTRTIVGFTHDALDGV